MRQYLNEHDIINSIRLELRHSSGKNHIWVLVEGETDQRLFSRLIDAPSVRIEIAHGGIGKLRIAVDTLVKETKQVLGIRDADFLHLDGKSESISNLFLTDYHDIEMMIISCDDSFRPLIAEYLNERLSDFSILRTEILQSIGFLAGMRWLNDQKNLELFFQHLGFAAFMIRKKNKLRRKPVSIRFENTPKTKNRKSIKTKIITLISGIVDYYNLCNGHDFPLKPWLYTSLLYERKGCQKIQLWPSRYGFPIEKKIFVKPIYFFIKKLGTDNGIPFVSTKKGQRFATPFVRTYR